MNGLSAVVQLNKCALNHTDFIGLSGKEENDCNEVNYCYQHNSYQKENTAKGVFMCSGVWTIFMFYNDFLGCLFIYVFLGLQIRTAIFLCFS